MGWEGGRGQAWEITDRRQRLMLLKELNTLLLCRSRGAHTPSAAAYTPARWLCLIEGGKEARERARRERVGEQAKRAKSE